MKINGRKIAKEIELDLKNQLQILQEKHIQPHLVIILIGNDPGSKAYIRQKIKRGTDVGISITFKRYPKHVSQKTLFRFIDEQNTDPRVHGIIIQRPIPHQIDPEKLRLAVLPEKDVDAFHPESIFQPPLALGVMRILHSIYSQQSPLSNKEISQSQGSFEMTREYKKWLTGKNIVFLGRGEAGGKPVISHVNKLGVDHTVLHSQTEKPEQYLKQADIIISAVGKERVVRKEHLKKGVILIGIGLHKGNDGKLKGDYEEDEIQDIASFYTPTPGGVGPVNVVMLLSNVIKASSYLLQ